MSCEHDMANGTCSQCDPFVVQNLRHEIDQLKAARDAAVATERDRIGRRLRDECEHILTRPSYRERKDALVALIVELTPEVEELTASRAQDAADELRGLVYAERCAAGFLRDIQDRIDKLGGQSKRINLNSKHKCPSCGKMTRDSTAGCDHCDLEDK
jgi:rubrerythrin